MNGPWSAILRGAYNKSIEKKRVKCPKCSRTFANKGNLANHLPTHKKSKSVVKIPPKFKFNLSPHLKKQPVPSTPPTTVEEEKDKDSESPAQPPTMIVTKTNKSSRNFRPNWKILALLKKHDSLPHSERLKFRQSNNFTKNNVKKWRKRREELENEGSKRSSCRSRRSLRSIQKMKAAKFPVEEAALHKEYKARRAQDLVVDYEWLKANMKIHIKKSGKDPEEKFKASNKWVQGFMKRKGLSVQKKTGEKHRPTAELLPRVKNFHWYSIYQMASEDP